MTGHVGVILGLGFGVGCLAVAGRPPAPGLGWALLAASAAVAAGATRWGDRRGQGSSRLLAAAGLGVDTGEVGRDGAADEPRTRILAAAGLPGSVAPPRRAPRGSVLLISALLAGAGWASVRAPPTLGSLDGRFVRFRGTAASDARLLDFGWAVEIRLDRITVAGRTVDARPKVSATGTDGVPPVSAGQPVTGSGTLEDLPRPAEGFDAYLLSRGVTARLRTSSLVAQGPPGNVALRTANAVRDAFRRGAEAAMGVRSAGLLLGLAIGDTASMDPEVEEDFRATGLTHLLAVSGSNVALVVIPALALVSRLGIRPGGRAIAALAAVTLFALVTRWEPSVLRASVMAAIGLAALWAGRPRRAAPALGVTVLVLLLADPVLATSVGFQLSVAATAGLVAMAGPLAARLSWLPRPVAAAAAATLAAQVAVTPLLLVLFGSVPTVALLANVLAFPAVAPGLFLGALGAGVALVWRRCPSGI